MEENVALDSRKQKQFVKSIKGIKKLIKQKNDGKLTSVDDVPKIKDGGIRKKKHKRGLVYLSHIPHGFYEHEMTQYFKQFGVVTNARVIWSKRTGNSKGYAFVEFKEPSVGEIVADTMNNYLMGKRLIKAAYIPPDKQKRYAMRKHWNAICNPGHDRRIRMKKAYNANKDEAGELQRARKLLSNLNKNKKKLNELGINYEFFTPVDVPEVLLNKLPVKEEIGEVKENLTNDENVLKSKKKNKKKSKSTVSHTEDKKSITKSDQVTAKKPIQDVKVTQKSNKKEATNAQESGTTKKQKQKRQNLKDKGVQPPEDFIKVQEDSDSDDSTYQFDSDEYEKMLENEDEFNSDITSGENSDEAESGDEKSQLGEESSDEDGIEDESVEDLPPIKKGNDKPGFLKMAQSVLIKHAGKQMQKKLPQLSKRIAPEILVPAAPKKQKFNKKQNKPPASKQFKKKK